MASFGSALRRTREEKGISLDDIAGETRLSKRYLLALEDEAIHKLPGGTYNRAYLRTYAGYLGLDTEGLVRQYSLEEAHQTETGLLQPQPDVLTSIGKAVESRQTTTGAGRSFNWNWTAAWPSRKAIQAGLAALAVLLLIGVLWFGVRSLGRSADPTTAPAAADRGGDTGRADRATTPPPEEAPEPSRSTDPPAAAPASAGRSAVPPARVAPPPAATNPAPVAAAPAPAAIKPVDSDSEKAAAAAASRAAAAAAAKARSTAAGTSKPTRGRTLSVTGSGVGTNVVDKRLVGESDTFAVGTRVTFWTRVAGGKAGDTINHVWFHNGVRIGTTSLRIGSADWRTQSRQLLTPDGEWAVEARDADGRVLARQVFHTAPK